MKSFVNYIVNEGDILQEEISPSNVLASQKGVAFLLVNALTTSWCNSTTNLFYVFAEVTGFPILRYHPHLGLLVALRYSV
ncbi:MAG: hypothetical protein A2143_02205 [Gallionellales bacterium RBG_16_57_15]|nr:MAG: hypothetical protein A2143_02205 [Gallionellales bacterium RBG_16_57_15]